MGVTATGSGTSITVTDAGFFFDGWNIGDSVSTATIVADTIQVKDSTATAVITAINYTTNVITLGASLAWTQGDSIALAWSGNAPDIGAIEFTGTVTPPASTKSFGMPYIKKVTP